jgi:hypothetical protein
VWQPLEGGGSGHEFEASSSDSCGVVSESNNSGGVVSKGSSR